ncbi:hypothetical protein [Streptomyces sp. SID13031]|uniref:hypothetical protein n=1 Tax=Streptomyces sp. SID13031 TaxID=2706046 RepID=UPI0013CBC528|nr:hypothetical protein [Streptomyces sp. SID13031]NEA31740.1 hypothetical protein [Streptomyces sp. SID13031]
MAAAPVAADELAWVTSHNFRKTTATLLPWQTSVAGEQYDLGYAADCLEVYWDLAGQIWQ